MANTRSARKRIRANEAKHVRNRAVRSAVRTKVTKARHALLNPAEQIDTSEALRAAVSALDRAAEKGILHANNARRRKSRLATMAASLQRAEGAGEGAAARSSAAGGAKGRTSKAAAAKSPAKSSAKAAPKSSAKAAPAKAAPAKAPKAAPAKAPAAKSSRAAKR